MASPYRTLPLRKLVLVGALGVLGAAAGCSILGTASRVRSGQLYTPGEARFDGYFADVHAQQVIAAKWPDDRKAADKPLLDVLKLTQDATDSMIAQATRDHLSTGALRLDVSANDAHVVAASDSKTARPPQTVLEAVEQTARANVERAKGLDGFQAKVDEVTKTGKSLDPQIADAFSKQGGQKPLEVKQEMHASFDVLAGIREQAKHEAKVTTDFVADLQRAVASGKETSPPRRGDRPDSTPHVAPPKPAKHDSATPVNPPTPEAPLQPAAPKPAPKPADTGEVFQP